MGSSNGGTDQSSSKTELDEKVRLREYHSKYKKKLAYSQNEPPGSEIVYEEKENPRPETACWRAKLTSPTHRKAVERSKSCKRTDKMSA